MNTLIVDLYTYLTDNNLSITHVDNDSITIDNLMNAEASALSIGLNFGKLSYAFTKIDMFKYKITLL